MSVEAGGNGMNLFDPIVPEASWHPSFRAMKEQAAKEPGRVTMQRVFEQMGDRDGNFRQQFQTTGFDSRVWELYLYAALGDVGALEEVDAAFDRAKAP